MLQIDSLDHLVLTVQDIEITLDFYTQILGMDVIIFGENRKALRFGNQKINLHECGNEFTPRAKHPLPGSADLCFITQQPIETVLSHLQQSEIDVIDGPVYRTGTVGQILSVYFRDPDGNLIEVANYAPESSEMRELM